MANIGFGRQYSNIRKIIYNAGVESSLHYLKNGYDVEQSVPNVRLVLSPWFAPFVPVEIFSQDVGGLIMNCSWAKSRSAPHGSAQLTLAGDEREAMGFMAGSGGGSGIMSMRDLFKPMTYCQLWLDGYHVLSGYVRSCRRRSNSSGNVTYSITIDELGGLYQQSVLELTSIMEGLHANFINDPQKLFSDSSRKTGMPLAYTIVTYVEAFIQSTLLYGTNGMFRLSDGLPLAYRMTALPPPIGGISQTGLLCNIITDSSLFHMAGGGSFWDFLRGLALMPYMELFTESGGRTICVGRLLSGSGASAAEVTDSTQSLSPTSFMQKLSVGATNLNAPNISALLPGFSHLVLRTAPYDNLMLGSSLWHTILRPFGLDVFDLILAGDFVIITDEDVIEKDLGQSDAQQFTVFDVPFAGKAGSGPGALMTNRPSIARGPINPLAPGGVRTYGARILRAPVNATSISWAGVVGQSIEQLTKRNDAIGVSALSSLLNYWFRNAAKFNEGSIVVRGKAWARPGMVLLYLPPSGDSGRNVDDARDIGLYYIENVTYTYDVGKAPTTTLTVVRGTPLPFNFPNLVHFLLDWDILPVGLNLWDGEVL